MQFIGCLHYNVDSLRCSFEDFNFLIQRNYMLPDSHYMRALIYFRYNMKDQGCKDMLKAKELGGQNAEKVIEENCK